MSSVWDIFNRDIPKAFQYCKLELKLALARGANLTVISLYSVSKDTYRDG